MVIAAINWHTCFFLLFALLAAGFAIAVLLASNVVRMATSLIVSLSATAGLFMLAGAEFVGAMQIMIYVGGTLVLLVFGVMLTAQASFLNMKTAAGEWVLAAILGGAVFFLLVQSAISVPDWTTPRTDQAALSAAESKVESPLGLGLLGIRTEKQPESGVLSGYLLPFEIVSIHLLVVLVGAAYLARSRRHLSTLR
jgi:NADH:ubiquinone oxidoreductase subunit 6 (subunit J)